MDIHRIETDIFASCDLGGRSDSISFIDKFTMGIINEYISAWETGLGVPVNDANLFEMNESAYSFCRYSTASTDAEALIDFVGVNSHLTYAINENGRWDDGIRHFAIALCLER